MISFPYQYPCDAPENYDGDTLTLILDRGFGDKKTVKVRLYGIDTPELIKAKGVPEEEVLIFKAAGRLARDRAREFLDNATEHGASLYYRSVWIPTDGFGRGLGDVVTSRGDSLVKVLLDERLGIPYFGKENRSSKGFINRHRENIKFLVENGLTEDYGR